MHCVDFINSINVCSSFVAACIVYMPLCSLSQLFFLDIISWKLSFCSFFPFGASKVVIQFFVNFSIVAYPLILGKFHLTSKPTSTNCWKASPRPKSTPDVHKSLPSWRFFRVMLSSQFYVIFEL